MTTVEIARFGPLIAAAGQGRRLTERELLFAHRREMGLEAWQDCLRYARRSPYSIELWAAKVAQHLGQPWYLAGARDVEHNGADPWAWDRREALHRRAEGHR